MTVAIRQKPTVQSSTSTAKVVARGSAFQAIIQCRGKRFRRQFATEIEANSWCRESQLLLAKGKEPERAAGTVSRPAATASAFRLKTIGQLSEYLIEHKWRGTKGEKAATINMRHIARVVGGGTALGDISSHSINLAVAALRDAGYPDGTINKKLSPLRVCLKYAEAEGWIERVPHLPFFKPGQGRLRYFTAEEEKAQLDWCMSTGNFAFHDYIVLSMDTGLRQGEAITLKARNIHNGRVTVWGAKTGTDNGTKAGTTRSVPLTKRALEVCERLALDNPGTLLPFQKDQITRTWNTMRAALGFASDPEYVPHAMRHTFCSRLVMAQVNLVVVQRLAGHLRIETTCKYVHLDDGVLVSAIARLEPAARH